MMSEEQKRQDDIDTIVIWHGKGYTDSQIVKMWNEVEEEYGGNRMLDEVTVRKVLEEEREREWEEFQEWSGQELLLHQHCFR